jgi:DnaJ family protein A protein 2
MEKENLYNILEVPETASAEDIKKAYRKMSLKWHPDKNQNSQESIDKFQKISAAYEILGNPEKKDEHDMMRNNPFASMMGQRGMHGQSMGPGGMHGINLDDLMANLFAGAMGMGPGMGQGMGHGQGPDIFQAMHHLSGGHNLPPGMFPPGANVRIFRTGPGINGMGLNMPMQKPSAIQKNLTINMEMVLTGGSVPLEIERWIIENGNKIIELQTVYVTVPKGIDNNEIIVLENQGNVQGPNCKGDVKVFIKIENDTGFERRGLDLIYDKKITLKESLCGFSFELKYINNKTYTINNKSGNIIPPEYMKIIPAMGLTRDNHTGNLIIHFILEFPASLSAEQIETLEKIL